MQIAVWSLTSIKVDAVRSALSRYDDYRNVTVMWISAESGVPAQPIGMEETITGAKNRAKNAFERAGTNLGFGLEGGLVPVPHTKSGYMNVGACAIYDGKNFHVGLSGGFEYPKLLVDKVLLEKTEVSVAAREIGLISPDDPFWGQEIVGRLTDGIVTRQQDLEWAVHMAMIHLRNQGY